jgi:pimeloyl-ACP methyl ester carboxylesterase
MRTGAPPALRAGLLVLALSIAASLPGSAGAAVKRERCGAAAEGARCGSVRVPLDRSGTVDGSLRVFFERYPRRDRSRPRLGTLVAIEGGPGYSSTDSRSYFMGLLGPLRSRRDVLFVDLRGTGRSGALDCRAFRRTVEDYLVRAERCARQLGPRRDFYGTRAGVADVAAVLDELGIGKIDLYGDSYGTFAGQAFAVHHGDRLRSLVLDAAYPLPGTDPAYGDLAEATQRALRIVCERRPSCAARGEDPLAVVARMVARVRARPFAARGRNADGRLVRVRVDEDALTALIQSGYGNMPMYRDVLAAIRSFEAGDRAPLLRLLAENKLDPTPYPVRSFSEAAYLAVTCFDYPQMWDPAAALPERRRQLDAWVAGLPPERYAPFSPAVWTGQEYEGATACLRWPAPRVADPVLPPGAVHPDVPTLVLNGDLDNITATSGAQVVAARFPRATFVEVANSNHVTALSNDNCVAPMVRRFIRRLDAGDTSCAGRVAEVRTVDVFPRTAADVEPAAAGSGDRSSERSRRVAAVAAMTVADAIARWALNYSGASRGLRGGRWSYAGDRVVRFRFRGARFARDVPVSGVATWRIADGAVHARLRLPGRGRLTARWSMQRQLAVATLAGRLDGRRLRATMLAP